MISGAPDVLPATSVVDQFVRSSPPSGQDPTEWNNLQDQLKGKKSLAIVFYGTGLIDFIASKMKG